MREPPLEGIGDEVVPPAAREGLDEEILAPRQERALRLRLQQLHELAGQALPAVGSAR
jgi:hypothetical protein